MVMRLVRPGPEHLAAYAAALAAGYSPDTQRPEAAAETLAEVTADPVGFLARQEDLEGTGPPVTLPDGTTVPRLPGLVRWMWDGGYAGGINLRWRPGTTDLPPTCLGHVGYAVVPERRGRGYATQALHDLLPTAAATGLPWIEIVTDPENIASQRVIESNGGTLVERFALPAQHGPGEALRYQLFLSDNGRSTQS